MCSSPLSVWMADSSYAFMAAMIARPPRPRKRARAAGSRSARYFFPEESRAEDHSGSSTVPEARMAKILENGVVSQ